MAITTTSLPPQAYTRDTLVKAIEWLSTQPQSVRERAASADLIVSFYLQARRRTAVQMEAPVSSANFQSDLKHLAQNLNRFDENKAPPPPPSPRIPIQTTFFDEAKFAQPATQTQAQPFLPQQQPQAAQPMPTPTPPPPPAVAQAHVVASSVPVASSEPAPPARVPETTKTVTWTVDPRSFKVARELKQKLNLSDEGEALRLLISLGKERAAELFPET